MRILLVEDEVKMAQTLADILKSEHYTIDLAFDGEEGYFQATTEEFDLMILDVGLPKMSGWDLCEKIRKEEIQTPIIMLTARDTTKDKIRGLDSGADDYLIKPFEVDELLARIRALLRRRGTKSQVVLKLDNLMLDPKKKLVKRAGKEITLSAREYALLEYFMRNQDQVISKQTLLEHVWGSEVDPFSNVIDVYIGYLRKKIDKDFSKHTPLLSTIKGLGYKLTV